MSKLMNLNFKSTTLDRYGLPDITYLIPIMKIQAAAMDDDGTLPMDLLLYGLQLGSYDGGAS